MVYKNFQRHKSLCQAWCLQTHTDTHSPKSCIKKNMQGHISVSRLLAKQKQEDKEHTKPGLGYLYEFLKCRAIFYLYSYSPRSIYPTVCMTVKKTYLQFRIKGTFKMSTQVSHTLHIQVCSARTAIPQSLKAPNFCNSYTYLLGGVLFIVTSALMFVSAQFRFCTKTQA